ncbi:MAG: right-handed parallel beta-helix repeat-containing protein [Candidatus Korobacteraceae bacterium]|jgi:hypothetical protein
MFSHKHSGALVVFALLLFAAVPALAATWTVTSLADDGSAGTLRYVLAETAPGDTVTFSVTGTITLTQGALTVNGVTITGPGARQLAISGGYFPAILQETPLTNVLLTNGTVSISGVTVEDGYNGDLPASAYHGGAAITNFGPALTISNSVITGNYDAINHGIIMNICTVLTITDSTISNNTSGSTAITNITCPSNVANPAPLTVTNSTFSGNSSGAIGGGDAAVVIVTGDTFTGNGVPASTGGLFPNGVLSFGGMLGTFAVTNSTFSGNSGIAITNFTGNVTVANSTFSGNTGGAIYTDPVLTEQTSSTTVKNSLLANGASGGNCLGTTTTSSTPANSTLISGGHNLTDDTTCTAFTQLGDVNNPSGGVGLSPSGLQNNGGPTETIALLATSPAVNAIPAAPTNYCTDASGNPLTTDQRGVTRPQGTGCDIGAYELVMISGMIKLVNSYHLPVIAQDILTDTLTFAEKAPTTTSSCLDLSAFIIEVDLARDVRDLTAAQASQLITDTNEVKTSKGCR